MNLLEPDAIRADKFLEGRTADCRLHISRPISGAGYELIGDGLRETFADNPSVITYSGEAAKLARNAVLLGSVVLLDTGRLEISRDDKARLATTSLLDMLLDIADQVPSLGKSLDVNPETVFMEELIRNRGKHRTAKYADLVRVGTIRRQTDALRSERSAILSILGVEATIDQLSDDLLSAPLAKIELKGSEPGTVGKATNSARALISQRPIQFTLNQAGYIARS